MSAIQLIKGNPQGLLNDLMQNPQFVQFYNANKGKTAEQLLSEYGLDRNVLNMLR